jgi:hypothetical protein
VRAELLRPKLLKNVARLCTTAKEIHGPVQSRRAMLRSVIGIALVISVLSVVVMLWNDVIRAWNAATCLETDTYF